jgi:hypothetical protein
MSDRKYRHRGYMDDDRDEPKPKKRRSDDRGRPFVDGGPRGRGLGAPSAVAFKCAVCGTEVRDLSVDTETCCPSCGKPLRSCTNCSFFDTSKRFECRKPIERRIESKGKANDCKYYQPKQIRELKAQVEGDRAPQDPRAAFDALFKK